MDKHNDGSKEFLHRPERPAVLLDTSGGLSLGPLPGLEDFSKTIPGLLPCLDAGCAGFLKVHQVTQSPNPEELVRQLVQIAHRTYSIDAVKQTEQR